MARESTWTNADGVEVGFGTRNKVNDKAASVRTTGRVNQLVVNLFGSDLPGTGATNSKDCAIPAGAVIKDVTLEVITAGTGTITVGTKELDGTAIDADGLLSAVNTASVGVAGTDGSLIGTRVSQDSYISTSAATAGALEGILTVEYIIGNAV